MRLNRLLGVIIALSVLGVACTADGDTTTPSLTSDTTSPTDNDADDAATSNSTTSTSTTTPTVETRPTQTLEGAWSETWRVLLGLGAPGLTNAGLAGPAAAEALGRLPLEGATTAEHYPRVEIVSGLPTGGGEMAVTDCVLFDNRPPVWLTGYLTRADETEDWVVSTVEIIDPFGGCVPKEVADAAIAGAQAFRAAQTEFWNPADPSHALIAETTTGDYRTFLERLLGRLESTEVRANFGGKEPNFGVIRVDSSDQVVLESCYTPDLEYGFYLPNGDRIEGSPAVVEGQTDLEEPTMTRKEEGDEITWKVSNLGSSVNHGCDPNSGIRHLPIH